MTTDYTQADSKLMFSFPETLEANRFKLVEYRTDHAHVFNFTLLDEQPNSELNQTLCKAISSKAHVLVTVARNDGETRSENVVVRESATKEPNDYCLSVIGTSDRSAVQSKPD